MQDLMAARLMNTMTEYSNNEITSVINYGFAYQTNLTKVRLENCKTINMYGFISSGISELYLPNLASIGLGAFRSCKNLKEFITNEKFNSRLDAQTFESCDGLIKADFYHISNLGIGGYALSCANLVTLIIRNMDFVPSLSELAFGGSTTKMNTGEGKIYVPASMVDAYKATANWSNYANQIYSIEELTE